MKRRLSIILIILVTLIVVPFSILLVLSKIHHQSAHNEFVDFLNSEFEGKASFQDFSYSYIRHFPKVHIQLKAVSIRDNEREVLKIGNLDILINMQSLWRKKIKLEDLIVHDAELYSVIDSLGNKTQILAGSSEKSDSIHEVLLIEADNIRIYNSKLFFENKIKGNRTIAMIYDAWFDLEAKDSLLLFKGRLEGHLDSLISNNTLLFANQPMRATDVVFKINRLNGYKELQSGYIIAHTLKLTPRLIMRPHEDGQLVDLHITGEDNFDTFLDLFEFHTGFDLQQSNPEATLTLSYNQNGFVNPVQRPFTELDFEIAQAEFTGEVLPFPLKIGRIKGNYNNGESHSPQTVELVIDTIIASVSESFINGRFKLYNLNDPFVDAHFLSNLDLSHLVLQNDNLRLAGVIDADLNLKGKISELKKLHLEGQQVATGHINVQQLELVLNDQGYALQLLNGATILNNHILEVTTLIGTFNESAFHFKGHLENLGQYILYDNEKLVGRFALDIDELDLTKMELQKTSVNNSDKSFMLPFSLMALEFNVNAKKIITEIGDINNLALDCRLEQNRLKVNSMKLNYQEGSLWGSADMFFIKNAMATLKTDIKGQFTNLDFDLPKPDQKQDNKKSSSFHFPDVLQVKINLSVEKGNIEQIPVQNLILQASMQKQELSISRFAVDAFDGHASLMGKIKIDSTGIQMINLNSGLNFIHLDLDELLQRFGKDQSQPSEMDNFHFPEKMDMIVDLNAKTITYKDALVSNFRAHVKATEDQILIKEFYTDLPFGNLGMDMNITNYTSDQIKYQGSANLSIDTLDIEHLLNMEAFSGAFKPEKFPSKNSDNSPGFPKNINFNFNAKATHLVYQKAYAENIDLSLNYTEKLIELEKLNFTFANGSAYAKGHIQNDLTNSYPGYLYSKIDSIDIANLFTLFNNFKQDVFTNENSSGKISWASHSYFELDKTLIPLKDKNLWLLSFIVHQAELVQVAPIENALFFVGHKSKDKMVINRLNANAFMFQNKMYFTDVLMNDNIANLDLFGEVDLENKTMDLGLEISLSDLFFRSKKNRLVQTKEGVVNLEKDAKIFLNINGPLSDHKLSMSSKRKFNNDRKDIMDEIKKAEKDFQKKRIIK